LSSGPHRGIAIIGMACVFPGAEDVRAYWENILAKKDSTSDPPPEWEADFYYDPDSSANDRTYCKRGGYLGKLAEFDPMRYGVMPSAVDGAEPDHFLSLRAAYDALADAGYRDGGRHRERTEVIIGRGTYVNRGNANALQHGVMIDSVLRVLRQLHPEHSQEELAKIKQHLKAQLPPFHADTAPGLVPNIISGRICNRLDLMGSNYIVDAACASSLVAIDLAVRDLETGRCDMVIAGGVNASVPPVIMIIFSQLKALSRAGKIRPFDKDADGTLLAEGVGMVVLKRLEDAERDGDRIYALIKGVGTASDGRAIGLLAPRLEGEELALRRAYEDAGVDPATVGLVEAHGTSTPVGDAVELEALRNVFGARRGAVPECAIGSVKSMIGHTMPASGAAGLIKAALALHQKVLPPTLNCETANPKLGLETSGFYINSNTRPWIHGAETPRRAGVNAFGFGGINAHAVLEEYRGPNTAPNVQHTWDSELFVVAAERPGEIRAAAQALLDRICALPAEVPLKDIAWSVNCRQQLGPSRLTVVARSREELSAKLTKAIERLGDARTRRIRDNDGTYWFSEPIAGKLALLFPGEGAQYTNMLADACIHFPEVRGWFDLMNDAFAGHSRGYLLSEMVFPPPGGDSAQRLWDMDIGAEAVFCGNQAMYALLQSFGIQPDAMLGHSTGEHSSLLAANVVRSETREAMIRHILSVNRVFHDLNTANGIREGVLLSVAGVGRKELEGLVERFSGDLFIALDNCPHQVVLFGTEKSIQSVTDFLAGKGAICSKLPFGRAYHTPWFDAFAQSLGQYFASIPIAKPSVPLYSCVTAGLYPEDPAEIRKVAAEQWASTVRFRETIQTMYNDGVRIFVEVGPRNNLTGFVDDILRGKPYMAVPSNVQHRSSILQLHHMLAQLVAQRVPVRLERLYEQRATQPIPESGLRVTKPKMVLNTGLQPFRLPPEFTVPKLATPAAPAAAVAASVSAPAPAPTAPGNPILAEHFRTMEQFLATQQQVMSAYLGMRGAAPAPEMQTGAQPGSQPLITEILDLVPGVKAKARHRFSLNRELMFRDHTLGRGISVEDPSLLALPVVPLTVTMEILAEGGALLQPGKVLTGMREVRASRWITLAPEPAIEIEAQALEPGAVRVRIRESGDAPVRPVWAEGIMVFADAYPNAPAPRAVKLQNEHKSSWTPERLYTEGMFHGPAFQAVRAIARSGANGNVAQMQVLPRHEMIAGVPQPAFLTDPVILDAAGQVVAFWSQEELQPEGDIFPYWLGNLECYLPPQAPGTALECRVFAKQVGPEHIQSDIEIVDSAGRLQYRFTNWEDRRFLLPKALWRLRIAPPATLIAEPCAPPVPPSEADTALACCRVGDLHDLLESSHGLWMKVLGNLVLNRTERDEWQALPPHERESWLLKRCAAKDAVRSLMKREYGLDLCPADVQIGLGARGRLEAKGNWSGQTNLTVSVSWSNGTATAVAALARTGSSDAPEKPGQRKEHRTNGRA